MCSVYTLSVSFTMLLALIMFNLNCLVHFVCYTMRMNVLYVVCLCWKTVNSNSVWCVVRCIPMFVVALMANNTTQTMLILKIKSWFHVDSENTILISNAIFFMMHKLQTTAVKRELHSAQYWNGKHINNKKYQHKLTYAQTEFGRKFDWPSSRMNYKNGVFVFFWYRFFWFSITT